MQGATLKVFDVLVLICGYGVCLVMGLLCALLLWKMYRNEIDLSMLISEPNGHASMSRFQLLIFTMIVAISLFILVVRNWSFPVVSDGILTLLGISASTYAVGKGIQFSRPEGVTSEVERQAMRDKGQEISDTGARAKVTPTEVLTSGAPEGERAHAAPQPKDGE